MSLDNGFDSQVPSLPEGGGAVAGLGETFTPDLSTGTGSFKIPLDLPNGPNNIGPRLALRYDTAGGNGPFGIGFSLPLPRILRSIASGYPRYSRGDTLMLEGAGELLALDAGTYRPQVDDGTWRVEARDGGFRVTDRAGLYYHLGVAPASRIIDDPAAPAASQRVYAWHLDRIEDALGNAAVFTWLRDQNQLYLQRVQYGRYEIGFAYEARPDSTMSGRSGFLVVTALRCSTIELRMPGDPHPVLRRWTFSYQQHGDNGCSLLSSIKLTGFDAGGTALDAPPLTLGYSATAKPTLSPWQSSDGGIAPGPLSRTGRRVEILDWNGDGLPDLVEIAGGGHARVWPNRGNLTWGRPQIVGTVPLFSSPDAAVAFADMDGDGLADLVRADRPIAGYVPRSPAAAGTSAAFDRPVAFPHAPSVLPSAAGTRMADLDGDGMVDLMVSDGSHLALYYRREPGGWSDVPQIVPPGAAPVANLDDRHVFLADMTGDGSPALVRVTGAGVTYWPYLGMGRWADPIVMTNPPVLPFDVDLRRVFLNDVDGDGCADIVYVDGGRVQYWLNQAGRGFSTVREIDYVPTGQIGAFRMADMTGSGTDGILWASSPTVDRTVYFFLDLLGGTKPYLLNSIDNGVGLITTISYSTSADEAARDLNAGVPWTTTLPVVIPVVSAIDQVDRATGGSSRTSFRYHDGRYDGRLREFAGFGSVDEDQIGDGVAPTLRTTTWFHIGVDPAAPWEPQTLEERRRLRGLRGRLYRQERYGLDGSPDEAKPYDRLEQIWAATNVPAGDRFVTIPRLVSQNRTTLERTLQPVVVTTTTNNAWDAFGNVTDSVETSASPADPSSTRTLRTHASFAVDPAHRFLALPWRIRQFDGSGTVIADTITVYDNAAEGTVGAQGLVTRRSSLVLIDAIVTEVYGSVTPDFASLGYYRRPGEQGWWIDQVAYTRIDGATGLHGSVTGPRHARTEFDFDAAKMFPTSITDPLGNVTAAEHDYRTCQIARLVDPSGAAHLASYDALARLISEIEPGDTAALPTLTYEYRTAVAPIETVRHWRVVSGPSQADTIDDRNLYDGSGRLLEVRERDDAGEIVTQSRIYSSRGFLSSEYRPYRPASSRYASPDGHVPPLPHTSYFYDALGRLVRRRNPDGSFSSLAYGPLLIEEADEEDTRTDAGALHKGTPTRRHLDVAGKVDAIQQNLGGKLITTTYEYDLKGHLVRHVDAAGNVVRCWYDLLGRQLRVDRPERASVVVRDAAGNPVEGRGRDGRVVLRTFDANNRLVAVRFGSAPSAPIQTFTYHDSGRPTPPDAGLHTVGGRLVRVDDEGGTTIFDYDDRGRRSVKRWRQAGQTKTYDLGFTYRGDGKVATITYPDGGSGRRVLQHLYDARGSLKQIPSVATSIEYDLYGQRKRVTYVNGTIETFTRDNVTGLLTGIDLTGPSGTIRSTKFTWDKVGNLLRIDSPDAKLAATYIYDDLYRLTAARTDAGESFAYTYNDAGSLTHKSDVGDYRYGEHGAPATCLTSAGSQTFTYSPMGDMLQTPWGTQTFDPLGRLIEIAAPGGAARLQFTYDFNGTRVSARSTGAVSPASNQLTPDALFAIEGGVLVLNVFVGSSIAMRQPVSGPPVFLHLDHLGGVVAVTDASGAVVDKLRYDPYGKLLERTSGGPLVPFGFSGGLPEAWSGLLYLKARYYAPALGCFVSPDAIVQDVFNPATWAPYAYCGGNPTSRVDPSGRKFFLTDARFWVSLAAIAAIVALVAVTVASMGTASPATGAAAAAIGAGAVATAPTISTGAAIVIGGGLLAGGLIGGIKVAEKSSDPWDILTGVFVGAAVGGWAAYATVFGAPTLGKLTGEGLGGAFFPHNAILSGAINGTVTAEAAGFASKLGTVLTGKNFCEVATALWQGAVQNLVSGAVSGVIFGATLSNFATRDDIPTNLPRDEQAAFNASFNAGKFGAQQVPIGAQAAAVAIQTSEQVGTNIVDYPFTPGGTAEQTGVSGSLDNFATLLGDVVIIVSF